MKTVTILSTEFDTVLIRIVRPARGADGWQLVCMSCLSNQQQFVGGYVNTSKIVSGNSHMIQRTDIKLCQEIKSSTGMIFV